MDHASTAVRGAPGLADAHPVALPEPLVDAYATMRPRSREIFERACVALPGAETRSVTHFAPFPTSIERGAGSRLHDVDGHEYLDVVNNYTSLIHGNAFAPIVEVQIPLLSSGTAFSALHLRQLELAEALRARVASVEQVRFTNSGSEASALALRIARKATGRRGLVMATGAYHGGVDPFHPDAPEVIRVDYNQLDGLDSAITESTAAVFMEPFLGAGGVLPGEPEFLRAVQDRAREVGAVFVLDEVQSLRNGFGGMQSELGLDPDLTTMGKIIGGGLPIGAVGGRARLLELTSPLVPERLEHSGTFNGNIPAVAGGVVALRHLDGARIEQLNTDAALLAERIEAAGRASGMPVTVTRSGSIMNVHPGAARVHTPKAAHRGLTFRAALHLALLVEGVYAAPRGMLNLSTVLTPEDLEAVAAGYARAFEHLSDYQALLERDGEAA
ncbi:MAG TPA: aminotransferase class III-fold pyridoxal phosphate-dependent enzyme [Microbacteriaceae bacterium]|nr:aminotransferase class III-fold pyridoxal phosphate-dependent enzyme [Microbacteriaceae bacterium]